MLEELRLEQIHDDAACKIVGPRSCICIGQSKSVNFDHTHELYTVVKIHDIYRSQTQPTLEYEIQLKRFRPSQSDLLRGEPNQAGLGRYSA